MTTFQFTISLNDSEYIALEKLLKNAIAIGLAEESGQAVPKQEFVNLRRCETIHQKLQESQKNALMTSTSSFCR